MLLTLKGSGSEVLGDSSQERPGQVRAGAEAVGVVAAIAIIAQIDNISNTRVVQPIEHMGTGRGEVRICHPPASTWLEIGNNLEVSREGGGAGVPECVP